MLQIALITIFLSTTSLAFHQSQVRHAVWHTNSEYAAAYNLPLKRSTWIAELPGSSDPKRMFARQVTDAENPQAVDITNAQDVDGMAPQGIDSANPQDIDSTNLQVVGGGNPPPWKPPGGNIFNSVCKREIGEPSNIVTHVDVNIPTDGNTQSIVTTSGGHVELQCRRYKLQPSNGDEPEIDIINRSECEAHIQTLIQIYNSFRMLLDVGIRIML